MKAFISPAQLPTNFVGSWAGSETCSGTEHPGWTLTPDCTTPLRENAAVHHSKIDCRMAATGSFATGSAETACPQMSALHQYRPAVAIPLSTGSFTQSGVGSSAASLSDGLPAWATTQRPTDDSHYSAVRAFSWNRRVTFSSRPTAWVTIQRCRKSSPTDASPMFALADRVIALKARWSGECKSRRFARELLRPAVS